MQAIPKPRRIAASLAIAIVAATGCARPTPPAVPTASFPDLEAGETVALRAEAVARDAVRPSDLLAVLDGSGFTRGSERTFVGREGGVRSVTARVLRFEAPDGAGEYLDWLDDHAADILGASRREPPVGVDGGTAIVHSAAPGGCCPKAMTTVLVAWQRGNLVLTMLASGPDVAGDALGDLVRGFDRATAETEEA